MSTIAYVISFILGYTFLWYIARTSPFKHSPLHVVLAPGLGLGLSGLLTFLTFLVFNRFDRTAAVLAHLALISVFVFLSSRHERRITTGAMLRGCLSILKPSNLITGILWLTFIAAVIFQAYTHPYGEWDAWAIYNMKSKFLLLSDGTWKALFSELHGFTQPDYPILLPLINVWLHAMTGTYSPRIPLSVCVVFTSLCGLTLFAGLRPWTGKLLSVLASCLLLASPYFLTILTAQYADTLLAFYLLASLASLIYAVRAKDRAAAVLSGMLIGLMTFTKNEGIVCALLLLAISYFYLGMEKDSAKALNWSILIKLCQGLLITGWATLFFKIFLAPPNPDILPKDRWDQMAFLNWDGFMITLRAIKKEILDRQWCFVWLFALGLLISALPRYWKKEAKILSLFFFSYFLVILFIYLTTTNFDLAWRLTSTLRRIFCYLLPAVLFTSFYASCNCRES